MKTAMQELIEKLNNVKPTEFCSIDTIREWSKELLKKEKEQIKESYYKDLYVDLNGNKLFINAEDYYNKTYNI